METAINLPTDILASGDRTAVGKPEIRRHIEAWGMSGINSMPDLQD